MKCPFCGDQESKVVDSRHSEDGQSIRRRRECMGCQRRFTTYEIVESLPIIVVKRNGSRQNFDRNKILNSMIRAFDKRKVDVSDLDRITTEILGAEAVTAAQVAEVLGVSTQKASSLLRSLVTAGTAVQSEVKGEKGMLKAYTLA